MNDNSDAGPDEATRAAPPPKSSDTNPQRVDGQEPVAAMATPARIGPYHLQDVLGEGGMGTVYVAEQREPIRQRVALKVIKWGMDTKEVLARFEIEQHALSLMNHPNIARVLDAGATPEGRPYFVMEYVPGVSLTDYCDQNRLPMRDRLELFISICRAVHHAHQKGVIHRDLKPRNILVMLLDGRPVPKIIDFGVAKATGQRLTERTLFTELGQVIGTPAYMSPEQAEMSTVDIDTRTDVYSLGVILYELLVGTLPFDPHTLRHAALAEIHHIIREEAPPKPSTRLNTLQDSELAARNRGTDSRDLSRRLSGDLDWITLHCLEKDRTRRYESAAQLAEDVERHLRDEPVLAGPPNLGYQLTKFVRRNRISALAATAVFAALLVGVWTGTGAAMVAGSVVLVLMLVSFSVMAVLLRRAQQAQRGEAQQRLVAEDQRTVALEARRLAEQNETRAREAERTAEARLAEVLRLSDVKRLAELEERANALWPAEPEQLGDLIAWLEEAQVLAGHLESHRATLETLRTKALPYGDDAERDRVSDPVAGALNEKTQQLDKLTTESHELEKELETHREPAVAPEDETGPHELTRIEKQAKLTARSRQRERLKQEIAELEPRVGQRRTWRFEASEDQWRHNVLAELVAGLERFTGDDPSKSALASVRARIGVAEAIEERTISSPAASKAWSEAIADIASLPIYRGLRLTPQLGLIPLRRDPTSGLWEFWHVESGDRPTPEPDPTAVNPWVLEEGTGIVLVLIPGGTFVMGAQKEKPQGLNFDPGARDNEGPPEESSLEGYFIGRFAVTQGQWQRLTGTNPSMGGPENNLAGKQHDLRHPVEQVSWEDSVRVLGQMSLLLPTEAQWEYAARAGTTTPWWTGAKKESLQGAANLADRFAQLNGGDGWSTEPWLFDGYVSHAPVGTFRANPWGLHDVHGNVWEWVQDPSEYGQDELSRDKEEYRAPASRRRVLRGGSYFNPAPNARVSIRILDASSTRGNNMGLRAARGII